MGQNSEGSDIRDIALKYAEGTGLDIGCGREKIFPFATGIDFKTQGDLEGLPTTQADFHGGWEEYFETEVPNSLDYIFSSHLLEDFDNAYVILDHWVNAIKPGGHIILYLPIEEKFKAHCAKTGQPYNPDHKQNWLGYKDFLDNMNIDSITCVEGADGPGIYSFYVVLRKDNNE